MNRLSIIRVIIAIIFVSCTEGTVEIREEQTADIQFATVLSKASIIDSSASLAQAGGFHVWAYSHSGNWDEVAAETKTPLLENIPVFSTGGTVWSYGSPVAWPEADQVSFFAYAPAGKATVSKATESGVPVMNFEVNDSPAQQSDLLIAARVTDQSGSNYGGQSTVGISFDHALSQIKFSALLSGEFEQEVKITQIVFRNIYHKGEAALETPVSWTVDTSTTKSYTLTTANGLSTNALSSVSQGISNANGLLFLLPQTIERATDLPEMEVTLTVDGVAVSYVVPVFSTAAWLPGRSYNYQLIVFRDSLQVIMTDSETTLTDWNLSIMIQPVPLSTNQTLNMLRINTALHSLGNLNTGGVDDLDIDKCNYFALYLRNNVTDDITVDMTDYSRYFTEGKQVIFDAEKIVENWGKGENGKNYTFKIENYEDYWTLGDARQPSGDDLDGTTSATTATPKDYIRNKGSIILIRNNVPAPDAEEETEGGEETGGGE